MKFRTYWTLVKLSTSYRTKLSKQRSKTTTVLIAILAIIGMVPLEGFLFGVFTGLYSLLQPMHEESAVIAAAVVLAQLLAFVFGITFVASSIYLSRDLETFLVYPIAPWVLVSARFVALWLSELLTTILFAGPAFLVYGIHQGHVGTWFALVIMVLLVPVIPLMLAFIVTTIFMRMTNVRNLRDKLRYLGGIVGIGVYVLFQLLFRGQVGHSLHTAAGIQTLITGPSGYVTKISTWFPPSLWEIHALTAPGWTDRLTYWGLTLFGTAVLTALCTVLSQRWFLSGYLGSFDQTRKTKRGLGTDIRMKSASSPMWTLLSRDAKVFFRTPTFVMNAISGVVVGFFIAVFPMLSKGSSSLLANFPPGLLALAGAGVLAFIGTTTIIAGTSTTREGRQFLHLKSLPLSPRTYVFAKWWFANTYSALIGALLIVTEILAFRFSLGYALLSVVMGLMACGAYNALGVLVDLNRPNLHWSNEQQAMNGFRNLLLLLGEYVAGGLLAGVDAALHFALHVDWTVLCGVNLIVLAAALAVGVSLLRSNAVGLYAALE